MTTCISDMQLEACHEWRAAKTALGTRDSLANRERMDAAQKTIDDMFDAAHDCE